MIRSNVNLLPEQCAVLRLFCLYLFRYSDSLLHWRRSCRVTWHRVLCEARVKYLYIVSCRDWPGAL